MRKIAILVGFSHGYNYELPPDVQKPPLPGIIVDLYVAYQRAVLAGMDEIIVITDIVNDVSPITVIDPIHQGVANTDILTFMESVRQKGQYRLFSTPLQLLRDIEVVISKNSQTESLAILFYFTGHMKDGSILLPTKESQSHLPLLTIRNKLISSGQRILDKLPKRQIVMIIDACYATNAGLPFSLNEEMDSKSNDPYGVFKLLPGTSYLEPEIILITSSHPNSKSIVTEHGSLMTQAIYNYLVQAETARHQLSVSIERITTSVAELEERFEAPGGKDKRFDQKVLDWEIERHKRMLSEKMSQYSLGNTLLSLIHAVRYYINKVAYRNIDLWKREIVPTIAIYSTYPNLTHIWSWIYCPARTITKYTGSKQNIELHLLDK